MFCIYDSKNKTVDLNRFDEEFCSFAHLDVNDYEYAYWFPYLEAPLRKLAQLKEANQYKPLSLDNLGDSHLFSNNDIAKMTLITRMWKDATYEQLGQYAGVLFDFWMSKKEYTVKVYF